MVLLKIIGTVIIVAVLSRIIAHYRILNLAKKMQKAFDNDDNDTLNKLGMKYLKLSKSDKQKFDKVTPPYLKEIGKRMKENIDKKINESKI